MPLDLTVNGVRHSVDVTPDTPLLWVIRDQLRLTGTKFSCGIAQCGACTVHINGTPMRSCSVPVSAAVGKTVTTIEGLSSDGTHPVQVRYNRIALIDADGHHFEVMPPYDIDETLTTPYTVMK